MEEKTIKDYLIEIGGIITTIIGIGISVISAVSALQNGGFTILIALCSINMILALFIGYHYKIRKNYEKTMKTVKEEIQNKDSLIISLESQIQKNKEGVDNSFSKIVNELKHISKLNIDFVNKAIDVTGKSYEILKSLEDASIIDDEYLEKEITKSHKEYGVRLYDIYKRYTSNFLRHLTEMMNQYISLKKYNVTVSSTIKLFDKPLIDMTERTDITVYTAFRDLATYEKDEREVGKKRYTIDGNVDFSMCLNKEQYINNNIEKNDSSYANENTQFYEYYNCVVVVPIRIKWQENNFSTFGYLCCDCMNNSDAEIFGKEAAQLLFSAARIYATFLEMLNTNWYERMARIKGYPKSFLTYICNITLKK